MIFDKKERASRPDYIIIALLFVFLAVGLLMIYSASVVNSYNTTNNPYFYFERQLGNVLLGLFGFFIVSKIHYSFWKKMAPVALVVGILLSIAVFIPGLSFYHGGAKRWVDFGPISVQPSEFLKLGIVLYFAALFDRVGRSIGTVKSFFPFLIVLGVSALIVMAQPDMGTFLVIASISTIMFYVAGGNLSHILSMAVVGVAALALLIKIEPYRMSRLTVFLNPSHDTSGAGYQINQALIAIGTGGILGVGFNQSRQKYQYLPEAQTDSIIAIMAEELGLVMMIALLLAIAFFIVRGLSLAKRAPDTFARMVAVGIVAWVGAQSILNIAANLSLVPLTGIPLPFISYGGSSVVVLIVAFGILVNISKHCNVRGGKK